MTQSLFSLLDLLDHSPFYDNFQQNDSISRLMVGLIGFDPMPNKFQRNVTLFAFVGCIDWILIQYQIMSFAQSYIVLI